MRRSLKRLPSGGHWTVCLEVPGAHGQRETVEAAKESLPQAVNLIFEDRLEDKIPKDTEHDRRLLRPSRLLGLHGRPVHQRQCPFRQWERPNHFLCLRRPGPHDPHDLRRWQGNQTSIRDDIYEIGTTIVSTDARETLYTYNQQGQETSRTLPIGVSTTTNSTDFIESKVYGDVPLSSIAAGDLPASVCEGQLQYEVSFEGVVTAYRYDNRPGAGGRLAQKLYYADISAYNAGTPSEIVAYQYDAFGRVHIVDRDGNLATTDDQGVSNYDLFGQLVTVASPEGTLHYEYDSATGLHKATWTGTGTEATATTDAQYDYDALGRVTQVRQVRRNNAPVDGDNNPANGYQPEVTDYVYDLLGNLDKVRLTILSWVSI